MTDNLGGDNRLEPSSAQRLARWGAVVAWGAVIFGLSSLPNATETPSGLPISETAHLIEYGVLGLLAALALTGARRRLTPAMIAVTISLCLTYGVSDEWHQSFVPGRDPSAIDLALDAVGAVGGCGVAWLVRRRAAT